MPQDSVTYDNGNQTIYYESYDSLSAEAKHFVDSVSGGFVQVNSFKQKSDEYSGLALPFTILLMAGLWVLVKYFNTNPFHLKLDDDPPASTDNEYNIETPENECLTYDGATLGLSGETVMAILEKRFPFYNTLSADEQTRFLYRHKKFMHDKIFMIHDASGFREMPVLVCAAAIRLSFGLQEYMLQAFPNVNIFPQEFVRSDENGICFLEGNVSGNSINISWKHFLDGFRIPDDGDNVGLHEMAHAYYYQNMQCSEGINRCFVKGFPAFTTAGTKAFEAEKTAPMPFYSKYAQRNFQEFWAESVERFFERGGEMKNTYPDVYNAICGLLNQSPV